MSISPLSAAVPAIGAPVVADASAPGKPATPEELAKAADQFEAILLRQFLKPTMDSLMSSMSGSNRSSGADIYGFFMTDVFSSALSESGGMGFSHILQVQLGGDAESNPPEPS